MAQRHDRHGSEIVQESFYGRRTLRADDPLREYLEAGATVLDVGCGPGSITADIAEIVRGQVDAGLKPIQEKLEAADIARAIAQERADKALLREKISAKALKAGAEPSAIDFLLLRATDSFEVTDDAVVAKTGKYSAETAGAALSIDEWLVGATSDFGFAFKASKGGGADPKPGEIDASKTQLVNPTPEELGSAVNARKYAEGKLQIVSK
jgi:SAM-dependent methyltransferase